MPVSNNSTRLKCRGWSSDLDEKYDSGGRRYRSHSMHHDAQRAMVGVPVKGMSVRHLDNRQQRKQN